MRRLSALFMASLMAFGAFAQDAGPELLSKKELFEKTDLFEPQSVFANREANIKLLKDYEANKAAYKPSQLLPVAVCYLTVNALPQSKEAFEAFLKTAPSNKRALRTLGTISLLTKDTEGAISYYKRSVAAGDERSNIFLGSAYLMSGKGDEIKAILPVLKKLAKDNLEAFNVVMLYSMRDPENRDKALMQETIAAADPKKLMESATPDGLSTALRIYLADKSVWTPPMLVVPARAAALMEVWLLSRQCYRDVLKAEPKNVLALRGMGLVEYRTGDVSSASNYVKQAFDNGDKDAAMDGLELFLLSGRKDLWDTYAPLVDKDKLNPQLRAGLVQYAVSHEGNPEIFYTAALGKGSDLLYKDEGVLKLLKEGIEKYSSDSRAKAVGDLVKKGMDGLKAGGKDKPSAK